MTSQSPDGPRVPQREHRGERHRAGDSNDEKRHVWNSRCRYLQARDRFWSNHNRHERAKNKKKEWEKRRRWQEICAAKRYSSLS